MWTVNDNVHDELGNWGVCMLGTNTSDRTAHKPMFWSYFCTYSAAQRRKKQGARLHNGRSFHSSNKIGRSVVEKPNSLKVKKFQVHQSAGILYLYSMMHTELATLKSRLWGKTINANDCCDMLGQQMQFTGTDLDVCCNAWSLCTIPPHSTHHTIVPAVISGP
jgi:hypothetical protein